MSSFTQMLAQAGRAAGRAHAASFTREAIAAETEDSITDAAIDACVTFGLAPENDAATAMCDLFTDAFMVAMDEVSCGARIATEDEAREVAARAAVVEESCEDCGGSGKVALDSGDGPLVACQCREGER